MSSRRRILIAVTAVFATAILVGTLITVDDQRDDSSPTSRQSASASATPKSLAVEANQIIGFSYDDQSEALAGKGCDVASKRMIDEFGSAIRTKSNIPQATGRDERLQEIAIAVEKLRHLQFKQIPKPEYVSTAEMTKRIRESSDDEQPKSQAALIKALELMKLVPNSETFAQVARDVYSGQVLGYYEPETHRLVVRSAGDVESPSDFVTIAHELDHALTDQRLGLPQFTKKLSGDQSTARQSLAEGDATYLMRLYALSALSIDQLGNLATESEVDQDVVDDAPAILRDAITFPYLGGLAFVCNRFAKAGWSGVDSVYKKLPETTAQIMFPERYEKNERAQPVPKLFHPTKWKQVASDSYGALDVYQTLAYVKNNPELGLKDAYQLARGWAGGKIVVYKSNGDYSVGASFAQHRNAPSLCRSFTTWGKQSFKQNVPTTDEGVTVARREGKSVFILQCSDGEVQFAVAPSFTSARQIVGSWK